LNGYWGVRVIARNALFAFHCHVLRRRNGVLGFGKAKMMPAKAKKTRHAALTAASNGNRTAEMRTVTDC